MKSTGVIRCMDNLGRTVVPIEVRRSLGIEKGDPLEIFINGDEIILKKYQPGCTICNHMEIIAQLDNVKLCAMCRDRLIKQV